MHHLPVVSPPLGAPSCWGQDYKDGDIECGQCRFNDTCQKEVLRGSMNSSYPPMPSMPGSVPFPKTPPMPVPPPTPYRPPQPPYQVPVHPVTQYQQSRPVPIPIQTSYPVQSQQPYYQPPMVPPSQYAPQLPLEIPDPMVPWSRPGAMAPPYYFTQYPGETHGQRLVKNLILRGFAAIMFELFSHLTQWTWPPRRGN